MAERPPGFADNQEERLRAHLDELLRSPGFAGSARLCGFLRYIVERTLEGRGEEIKEYSIAVEVYARPADYDTQNESIVRVEASRLRKRLAEFYEGPGQSSEVRIELPRGTYRPVFRFRPPVPSGPQPVAHAPAPAATESTIPLPGPVSATGRAGNRSVGLVVAAMAMLAVAAGAYWLTMRKPSPPVDSIGVLPLVNLTGAPQEDAFTDGLTEDLTTALSRLPGLRVVARTTMSAFKNKPVDLTQAGKQVQAGSFLEGSVRRDGPQYVITVQLINAADGYHLWAETFRRPAADPVRLAEGLSREIAGQIDGRLRGETNWRTRGRTPPGGEALQLYLDAHSLLQKDMRGEVTVRGVPPHFEQAIAKLRRAVELEPEFAQAWVLLSMSYEFCMDFDPPRTPEFLRLAKDAANRAIAIDETVGEAHGMLGALAMYREYNLAEAEQHYRRAVELRPRDVAFLRYYSDVLRILGRPRESAVELDRGILLSPTDNRLYLQRSLLLYSEGQYEEALSNLRGVLSAQPANAEARWLRGLLLQAKGQNAEAEQAFRDILRDRPEDMRATPALGNLLGAIGRAREARELAAHVEGRIERGFPNQYGLALIYCGMGDRERAITWLERAATAGDQSLLYLMVEERFRPIHGDPRVQAIARRYGIPGNPLNNTKHGLDAR